MGKSVTFVMAHSGGPFTVDTKDAVKRIQKQFPSWKVKRV